MTEGLLIQRRKPRTAVWVPAGLALFSLIFGVWKGPLWSAIFSSLGLAFLIILAFRAKSTLLATLMGIHVALLSLSGIGYKLFLKPLSQEALQLPSLKQLYNDPEGVFEIRGPEGWAYERVATPHETGVRIRPMEPGQYMGVSEVTVLVRNLDRPPPTPQKFLESMANQMAAANPKPRKVQFQTDSIKLINGQAGLVGRLTAWRLWVPLSQVSIYSIKGKNKLCTVAASGLEKHSVLSQVLCLGLVETLKLKTPL
jgi:hypothetical protein